MSKKRDDVIVKAIAGALAALFVVAMVALTLWIRHSAPCWVFPLQEAPTRCLPGASR